MVEPYTTTNGYSGPWRALVVPPVLDQEFDVFGLDEVQLPESPLFPASQGLTANSLEFSVAASGPIGWKNLVYDLEAGLYRWTYRSGALNNYAEGQSPPEAAWAGSPWNLAFIGPYSNGFNTMLPTGRVWLRSNFDDNETFFFPAPAFDTPGYTSAEEAEAASAGLSMEFYHPGGPLDCAYDKATSVGPAQGQVNFGLNEVLLPRGRGYWDVVYSSLPNREDWPLIRQSELDQRRPWLRNLSPGLHIVRFYYTGGDMGVRYQQFTFWVWKSTPRRAPNTQPTFERLYADQARLERYRTHGARAVPEAPHELFPVRPPKDLPPGNGNPLINRQYFEQQRKNAGNRTELPETRGNRDLRPEELGDAEKF